MPITFPQNPAQGDTYDIGSNTFVFDGTVWAISAGNVEVASARLNTTVGNTAPISPNPGDIWIDATSGLALTYFDDGDTEQWVDLSGGASGGGGDGGGTSYDEPAESTGYFGLPVGTTEERPGTPAAGMVRYNSTLGSVEIYNTTGWELIGGFVTVSSVTPTTFSGAAGTQFTIVGSSFVSGAVVKFIRADLTEYTATTTTFVNSTELLATTPIDFTVADEPLAVKVVNPSGASGTKSNAIDCGSAPSFTTAAGSLGNIYDSSRDFLSHLNATAPDPDGGSVTYAITAGALPAGLSFNTANGTFTGTASAVGSDVTSTFTVQATDGVGNTNSREFSITVKAPILVEFLTVGTFAWTAPIGVAALSRLRMIGGGGGGNAGYQAYGWAGGGAGYVDVVNVPVVAETEYSLVVGAGGLGGLGATVTNPGEDGEDTTAFTNIAYGGEGGQTGRSGLGGSYLILAGTDNGSNAGTGGGTSGNNGKAGGSNGGGAEYGTGSAATGNYTPGTAATGYGNASGGGSSSQNWIGTRTGSGSGGLIKIEY